MDSGEELNYVHHYQKLYFQTENGIDTAEIARQCLVQTYSASLKLLDNEDALDLLKINLKNHCEIIDENDALSNFDASSLPVEEKSGINNIDINTLLKPLPCPKDNIYCRRTESVNDSFQEFLKHFNQLPSHKLDIDNEPNLRKIATQCCISKDKKTNKFSVIDKPTWSVESDKNILNSDNQIEETKSTNFGFKTAREELNIQNIKKFGNQSVAQTNQSGQLGTGGLKRKLGTRRHFQNKFVSPMLSNNNSEDSLPKSQEWPVDETVDERLKNIEPRMVELIRSEIMDISAVVDWDDIAGLEFAKTAIQEAVVWPLLRPDIFTGLRKPPKGILLFGPPGTGKTLIGKCVASQSKSTFFSISASSLTSKWIGDGEKMVRALFAVARCHQPAVIFIDEVDSLLSQRSDTEHESSRRLKTEFLVQLDGATTDNDERILVIGATNRPQELDEAARRRFVKRLYIPLPEYEARFQLVTRLMALQQHNLNEENIKNISKMSDGYSGADMKNLCSEASLGPIRCIDLSKMQSIQAAEIRPVNMDDFIKALERVKSSVSPKDLEQYLIWNKTYGSGCSF